MVQKLQAYDPNSESLTVEEARELVQRSGMIVFPGWDISSSFLLDQMRRQEKSISYEEINPFGELQGAGFNIDTKTMAIWSVAPESEKPTLMEIKETPAGNVIFWNAHSTSSDQIYNLQNTAAMLGKNKIDILQEQLVQTYEKYLDARKKYEEEMRRTYVLQQALEETKKENEDLKREERSLRVREVQDQNIQTDQIAEEPHPVTHMDVDEFEISNDAKIKTMK